MQPGEVKRKNDNDNNNKEKKEKDSDIENIMSIAEGACNQIAAITARRIFKKLREHPDMPDPTMRFNWLLSVNFITFTNMLFEMYMAKTSFAAKATREVAESGKISDPEFQKEIHAHLDRLMKGTHEGDNTGIG